MHYLSISAIFKQENPWLCEWLDYHLARGVEHFYLYNNEDDPTESDAILEPYIQRGLVESFLAPGRPMQMPCMLDAVTRFQKETHWLAFIDLDEFMLPRLGDDLRDVLQEYELYSGLCIHWTLFGSNNHLKRPPNQIDHFLRRAHKHHPQNTHVKSIVRPSHVNPVRLDTPHYFYYHTGHAVDENYRIVESSFNEYTGERIRLNHYIVRSLQDTQEVKIPRMRPDCLLEREPEFFEIYNYNDVYDDEISRRFGAGRSQTDPNERSGSCPA